MKDIIKGLWKWILAILIILVLGVVILLFRIFVLDKDFDGRDSRLSKGKNDDSVTDTINSDKISGGGSSDGKDESSNKKGSNNSDKNSDKNGSNSSGKDSDKDGSNSSGEGSDGDDSNNSDGTSDKNGGLKESLGSFGKKVVNGVKTIGNATVRGYKEDEEVYDYNVHNFDEWFLMYEGEQYDGAIKNILEHLISNSNGTFYARTSVTPVNFGNSSTIDYNGDVTEYQNNIKNLEEAVSGGMYDVSFKYGGFGTYVNEIVITKK